MVSLMYINISFKWLMAAESYLLGVTLTYSGNEPSVSFGGFSMQILDKWLPALLL